MYTAFPARLKREENDTFTVTFRDVPEAITFVEDRRNPNPIASEALATALSFYVEAGRPCPVASELKRGEVMIYLAAATVAKLALYETMRAQGITQSELARRLGCHRQHVARIVDPAHNTNFDVLEAALAAVNKRAALVIQDAA